MDFILSAKAAILGVVEGLTEFIPVSSTGHLIVADRVLGFADAAGPKLGKLFLVVIQLGAILAVCWYYRSRLWTVARTASSDPRSRQLIGNLVVGFIPAAVVGLVAHHYIEDHLFRPEVVAATLAIGGAILVAVEKRTWHPVHEDAGALPMRIALAIGCFQCLAILLPGTSRSGATIIGAMLIGVSRVAATEFSFFLAIPTMLAATGYDLLKHRDDLTGSGLELIAIGFVVSFIVALGVVHWLLRFVAKHTFTGFGWYRIAAGILLAIMVWRGYITAADLGPGH